MKILELLPLSAVLSWRHRYSVGRIDDPNVRLLGHVRGSQS